MRTIGQILKKVRLEKQIGLEEAEKATKIRAKYLQALEEDDFSKFSDYTSARGFLKNYAEFLGITSGSILAIFRRDFTGANREETSSPPLPKGGISWSPKLTLLSIGVVFFFVLVSYLGYQYFSLVKRPSLEIISPQNGKQVSEEKIEVVGKASRDALVTVNDNPMLLSSKGEFHYLLDLFPGENKIVVEAKTREGKKTTEELTVFRLDK